MEPPSSRVNIPNSRLSSKRLLFDRRYGWVIDEWKDPAEEALDGGRGMFCILPLAKALVQKASESDPKYMKGGKALSYAHLINLATDLVIKASEKPQFFSHQMLQGALDDGVRNFITSLKNMESKGFIINKNTWSEASTSSSHSYTKQ